MISSMAAGPSAICGPAKLVNRSASMITAPAADGAPAYAKANAAVSGAVASRGSQSVFGEPMSSFSA